jgi:CheY-like chemotaxis protein
VALSALLLSEDPRVIQVLRPLLPELGIHTDQCASAESGRRLLNSQKYEAIIVDADSPGGFEFMASLRQLPMTRNVIIFALTRSTSVTVAFQAGANFVLEKPLTAERAMRSFRAAQGLILRERRRYYRHPVEMFATLEYGNNVDSVSVTNLSEGGMALESNSPLTPGLIVKWKFDLPDKKGSAEGKGEVSWNDNGGHLGIRFVHVPLLCKRRLEDWLNERSREEPTLFLNVNRSWKTESGD